MHAVSSTVRLALCLEGQITTEKTCVFSLVTSLLPQFKKHPEGYLFSPFSNYFCLSIALYPAAFLLVSIKENLEMKMVTLAAYSRGQNVEPRAWTV